jgi:hypothetical protein
MEALVHQNQMDGDLAHKPCSDGSSEGVNSHIARDLGIGVHDAQA